MEAEDLKLKTVDEAEDADEEKKEQVFRREARGLNTLRHPHYPSSSSSPCSFPSQPLPCPAELNRSPPRRGIRRWSDIATSHPTVCMCSACPDSSVWSDIPRCGVVLWVMAWSGRWGGGSYPPASPDMETVLSGFWFLGSDRDLSFRCVARSRNLGFYCAG